VHNRAISPAKLSGATRRLIASDDAFVTVTQSSPSGANGWAVSAQAIGDVGDWQVTAIVICQAYGPVEQVSSTDSTSPKERERAVPVGRLGVGRRRLRDRRALSRCSGAVRWRGRPCVIPSRGGSW
jgi:hypothetical protein